VHAKYILIDGWARVGSTNLNYRSQYHDLEADIVLCSEKNISTLATEFFRYCSQSKQLSVEDFSQRPWVLKLAARFFLLFKRWI
ncbi:MAG: hypothetical protein KDD35_12215, partial [Bdellovibrionales bacterium]|nr:hypothetical protein [Bdellovibrionales bacterium]